MLRTRFSFRGLILVFGLVAVGLPIALVWQLGIDRSLNVLNEDLTRIRQGQLATARLVQYQLDEETAIRGYAATGRRVFLEPYTRARAALPRTFVELEQLLRDDGVLSAPDRRSLGELRRLNGAWLREVADPVVVHGDARERLLLRGKTLIDRFRREIEPLSERLGARYVRVIARRNTTIATTTTVALASIAVIALEIIVFAIVIARMRHELDRERGFVETLQDMASVRLVAAPHLAIATAYRSATRGTRVGGDLYDVYQLDADRTLLVIGDVSGKGLAAAIDTTFVRFALRALAGEGLAPPDVARRFDALYRAANPAPEAFVTLFVGIHDRSDGTLAYVNAGHEACWVRGGGCIALLAPTGPVIGLGAFEGLVFAPGRTTLATGDLLILATDGLTEARDPRGTFAPIEQVTGWILEADDTSPQAVVDAILAAVQRRTRGRITDDLAILVVQPLA